VNFMSYVMVTIFAIIVLFIVYRRFRNSVVARRQHLIDTYRFPASIARKINEKYPHLSQQDTAKVMHGLREYFHLCNIAGKRMVSMPSQAVDVAWHEFILFTRNYEQFCRKALGRFLHHTPAEAMLTPTSAQSGIKTAWKISCYRENIKPKSAHKLPLLFAIDAELNIPDGFMYSLNCTKPGSHSYCASNIGCGTGCGSGCASGCSSADSSSCSSGCGGGGD
jgi:hypothetical protein